MTSSLTQPAVDQPAVSPTRRERRSSQLDWVSSKVFSSLRSLKHGTIDIRLPGNECHRVGTPADDDLQVEVTVHDLRFFRELAMGGTLGAAEAYIAGRWSCDDLTTLMRILCRNLDNLVGMDRGVARLAMAAARGSHWLARNTIGRSQQNIAAHYDLGNEFFSLFLDPTLTYSSALFARPDMSLEEASIAKLDRVCRKLELEASDHLVEIGTGWGSFAMHAAREYGCRVTTTTISRRQFELAQSRVDAAGLGDRINIVMEDYRTLAGQFDKLASIEMIEAVGHEFLPAYFAACDRLLKPGGRMAIQAITMPEQRYDRYRRSVDFIQKYVFPGAHLPSVGAMQHAVSQGTKLEMIDALQFPDSYARTLHEWRAVFVDRLDEVRQLGFDGRFIRMWEYYLCYCEGAFLERAVGVGQYVWEKTRH